MRKKKMFYGTRTRTRPEKVLTKTIRRVRDFEDRILCPRTMATYALVVYVGLAEGRFFQGIEIVALTAVRATI